MNKQQLANRIWASANKVRSKIEANEYKDHILGFIFYKFLSEQEVKFLWDEGLTKDDFENEINEEHPENVDWLKFAFAVTIRCSQQKLCTGGHHRKI